MKSQFAPLLCVLLLSISSLQAADVGPKDDIFIVQSRSFLNGHPDLRYRIAGMKAYQKGQHKEAIRYFRLGAYYADKPSQAMVAEMLWKGEGVQVDRAEAYVWIDLAAERLYRDLIIKRENYWAELTELERRQALDKGEALYEKYGDKIAKRRIEAILERDRRNVTGSRVGYVGNLRMEVPGASGMPIQIEANQFYQDKFWQPEQYWAWQNTTWKALPTGTVSASELKPVESVNPSKKDDE